MKTLEDHVIIYDDECPMCDLYTGAFVKTKMLSEHGRQPFGSMGNDIRCQLDQKKAADEIALINLQSGKVTYGIDSLFAIIGHNFALLKPVFAFGPFRWIMKRLYSFISYNRKVIVPGKKFEGENACTPSLNLPYRWAYIVIAWIVTSLTLNAYSHTLTPLIPRGNFYREFIICGGQILFQSLIVGALRKERLIHYLGSMMTISLAGALLLLPGLWIIKTFAPQTFLLPLSWFAVVVSLMLFEHIRRLKILDIHWFATITWIIYRLVVLQIIL